MSTLLRDGRAAEPSTCGPRLLVVEDHPLNAKLLSAQLEQSGYQPTFVESGEAALAALSAASYAVVLMDSGLPGMDGCATTREIRVREGHERHTIVIGLSSNSASSARAKCLEAGMDGYIERPVTQSELNERIRASIAQSQPAIISDQVGVRLNSSSVAEALDSAVLAELAALPGTDGRPLLNELVDILLCNMPEMLRILAETGPKTSDHLSRAAHRLKSACTTIGAKRLAMMCENIEEACADDDQTIAEQRFREIPVEAARLEEKLKEIRSVGRSD